METFYYDFTRHEGLSREVMRSLYGEAIASYSDERLQELNIFPIKEPPIPPGYKISALRTAAEVVNEGPVYSVENGFAVPKRVYVPEDPTQDDYNTLWTLLQPSQSLQHIKELACQDLTDNVEATILLNSLTVACVTILPDVTMIRSSIQYFLPKLTEEEQLEVTHIFTVSGLYYLLEPLPALG